MDITFDIEANNLLNEETIDYNASPYVLKDSFKMHCIVVEVHETRELVAFYDGPTYIFDGRTHEESDGKYDYVLSDYEAVEYTHLPLAEFKTWIAANPIHRVVGQNTINYDFLACKLWYGMDYSINPDMWDGKEVRFEDTLVTSKCLNPDRFGGHSLDNLAKLAGEAQKIAFRKEIPQRDRFTTFAADMLYYNIYDTKSNTDVFLYLEEQKGDWDWEDAITLEKEVAEIITRQEHRGFKFDKDLAESNVKELDALMEERRQRVEPLLPPRPATKKFLKDHTPPASQVLTKDIYAPKSQFKKDRSLAAGIIKFAEKEGYTLEERDDEWYMVGEEAEYKLPLDTEEPFRKEYTVAAHLLNFVKKHGGDVHPSKMKVRLYGKVYDLPMSLDPLKTEMVATIDDTTHIKNWLVGLGWSPLEYKDKDITIKSGPKKEKRTTDELYAAIDAYVEESLASNLLADRMAPFKAKRSNFKVKLIQQASRRSCKVVTNPSFTVGQEKEMCPNLELLGDQFPYTKDIVEYLTYKHRRNSILGGGLEWEEGEDAEKGYLANLREDGRIATPADSCGTSTSRMKHKKVANIPRITSLYGDKMRALFGVDPKHYVQVGYDFSSLEARIEAHYCYGYDREDKGYCNSLLLEKPNDTHSVMARKVSELLGRHFDRAPAKSVRYGCSYGAQPPRVAKTIGCTLQEGEVIFNAFWELAFPLAKLKGDLETYWKDVGGKKFIKGIDGRKVPTRAEHALINSLFQSAGVICAKRTMVIHDRLLAKNGLIVDFFKDDWQNTDYCQQVISYHDESQLEETKAGFTFKKFNSEEEALLFTKEQDKVWSEPFKSGSTWFAGYSLASELISVAVDATTEYYNLNVPLHAGYILGRNWGECH